MERDRDWASRDADPASEQARRKSSPLIDVGPDGEAVIAGTRIEAHCTAALLDGGKEIDEIVGDYLSLNRAQVLAAKAYADAHPQPTRSYPRITAKKAMRGMNSDVLEPFMPPRD